MEQKTQKHDSPTIANFFGLKYRWLILDGKGNTICNRSIDTLRDVRSWLESNGYAGVVFDIVSHPTGTGSRSVRGRLVVREVVA